MTVSRCRGSRRALCALSGRIHGSARRAGAPGTRGGPAGRGRCDQEAGPPDGQRLAGQSAGSDGSRTRLPGSSRSARRWKKRSEPWSETGCGSYRPSAGRSLTSFCRRRRILPGRRASPPARSTMGEVRATLEAALADAGARAAVRSGRLTKALAYAGLGEVDLSAALALPADADAGREPGTPAEGAAASPARSRGRSRRWSRTPGPCHGADWSLTGRSARPRPWRRPRQLPMRPQHALETAERQPGRSGRAAPVPAAADPAPGARARSGEGRGRPARARRSAGSARP